MPERNSKMRTLLLVAVGIIIGIVSFLSLPVALGHNEDSILVKLKKLEMQNKHLLDWKAKITHITDQKQFHTPYFIGGPPINPNYKMRYSKFGRWMHFSGSISSQNGNNTRRILFYLPFPIAPKTCGSVSAFIEVSGNKKPIVGNICFNEGHGSKDIDYIEFSNFTALSNKSMTIEFSGIVEIP